MSKLQVVKANPPSPPSTEVLEQKRLAVIEEAVEAAPQVLQAMVSEALEGNVQAAKLVLSVAGLEQRGSGNQQQLNLINNIQISPDEKEALRRDFLDI